MLYPNQRTWNQRVPLAEKGVLVATDVSQEWLLSWWFDQYSRYNCHPVAFVDLGMSDEAKKWCQRKGIYLHLLVADIFVSEKQEIGEDSIQQWEDKYGKQLWEQRNAWFKKPLACLQTPFQKTLWIDLDCEILSPIDSLFPFADHPSGIAMSREDEIPLMYNSGVIVFQKGEPLLEKWAEAALDKNNCFPGDQDALSAIIREENICIGEIPNIYNWSRLNPPNDKARIIHWHGPYGKNYIRQLIMKNLW